MKTPTDLQILTLIYNHYYDTFTSFSRDENTRPSKLYVPIDVDLIADRLKIDGDIVFGRLYYHLNNKFSYSQSDGSKVVFFTLKLANLTGHFVQFPLLASVLADLRNENRKYNTATAVSIISLILAVASVMLSVLLK